MKRRAIVWLSLLTLMVTLMFAMTAGAAPPPPPHFETHGSATLDTTAWGEGYVEGVLFYDVPTSSYVIVGGYVDVKIDVKSVGDFTYTDINPGDPGAEYKMPGRTLLSAL